MNKHPEFEFDYPDDGMDNFSGWAIVNSETHKHFVKTKGFTVTDEDLARFASIEKGTKEEWDRIGMPLDKKGGDVRCRKSMFLLNLLSRTGH